MFAAWVSRSLARTPLGIVTLAAASVAPAAAPPPNFDVNKVCAHEAAPTTCVNMERSAKTTLTSVWANASPADQQTCAKRGTDAGGSYVVTLICLRTLPHPSGS